MADNINTSTHENAPEWTIKFLRSIALYFDVSRACRTAKITRKAAYEYAERNEWFNEAWIEALDKALDKAEGVMYQYATKPRPKHDKNGAPIEYSDKMMAILLSAHRPEKYREKKNTDVNVNTGGTQIVLNTRAPGSVEMNEDG